MTDDETDSLLIGVAGPSDGPYAGIGNDIRRAAQRAAERVNADGGINGEPVEIVAHDDHCAAWYFVADALTDVRRVDPNYSVDLLNYIVHFNAWPFEDDERRLEPPPGLRGGASGWMRFPLTAAELRTKRAALRRYQSQQHAMRSGSGLPRPLFVVLHYSTTLHQPSSSAPTRSAGTSLWRWARRSETHARRSFLISPSR